MSMNRIVDIISTMLIVLFCYAAISKWMDSGKFISQLSQSPITHPFSHLIFYALPLLELLVACSLIAYKTKTMGLYISLFIMSIFTAYIYIILNYSFYVPCSCGGVLGHMSWKVHFIFNMSCIFLIITAILIQCLLEQKNNTLPTNKA